MIKLIMNRFDGGSAKSEVVIGIKPELDTSSLKSGEKDIRNVKGAFAELGKTGLNINTSSLNSSIKQLQYIQKTLKAFHDNKQFDIGSGLQSLKDVGLLNTLPAGTQKVLSELEKVQNVANDDTKYKTMMMTLGGLEGAFKTLDSATKSTNDSLDQTSKKSETLSETGKKTRTVIEELKNAFKQLGQSINNAPSLIGKMQKAFEKTDFTKIVNFGRAIRRTTTSVVGMVESAAAYEESMNLYTMALGKYVNSAKEWEKRISEKLLLDPSQVMQYTGAFYNLTKGLKVTSDDAYLMSKNLTQLTYDMASYLNISNEAAYTKIQSAMAGQSRAVQSVGVATQVASLQELAYELGIKKKVSTMTQAEKTYLRYIQLMRSTEQMQGDLGRTMITPANAMRTLKTQVSLLGRSIGQVLTPFVMQAIPYIMALTNVLTEMAKALAKTFGYNIADINYSDLSFEDATDGVTNLNNLGNAAASAGKKAKNSLAPFDELNQVMSSSKSSGSGGIGDDLISKGVFDKILPQYDMLKNYNDKFIKQAKDLEGTMKKIIGFLGAALAVGGIVKAYQWTLKLLGVYAGIKTVLATIADKFAMVLIDLLPENAALKFISFLGILKNVGNIIKVLAGLKISIEGMNELEEGFRNGSSAAEDFANTLKVAVGGAMMGSVFGPVGMVVGAVVNLTASLVKMKFAELDTYKAIKPLQEAHYGEIMKEITAVKLWNTAQAEGLSEIYKKRDEELKIIDVYEQYRNKLLELVDANGKIKEGRQGEARILVNELNSALGTNIEIRNGEIKAIDKVMSSIDKLIAKKRAEVRMQAYQDAYKKSLMEEKTAHEDIIKAYDARQKAQEALDKYMRESGGKNKTVVKSLQKAYEEADIEYRNSYDHYREIMQNKYAYEAAYVEFLKGNYEKADEIMRNSSDHSIAATQNELVRRTEMVKGELGQELIDAWYILALTNTDVFNNALSHISDEKTRQNIIDNVSKLLGPLGEEGATAGNYYAYNFTMDANGYLRKNELTPYFKTDNGNIKTLYGHVQDGFNNAIGVKFTSGNAASTLRTSFVNYFNKNPINLGVQYNEGKSSSGGKTCIKAYANGGYPDSGDLFFANENGTPEFVTSIGQRTAVANQDQMVSALTNAILAGMQNIKIGGGQRGDTIVYIGNDKVYQGQGQYQSRQNDRYGTSVVRI